MSVKRQMLLRVNFRHTARKVDLLLVPQKVHKRMVGREVRMHRQAAHHHDHAYDHHYHRKEGK